MIQRLRDFIELYRAYRRMWPGEPRSYHLHLAWSIAHTLQRIYDEQTQEHGQ